MIVFSHAIQKQKQNKVKENWKVLLNWVPNIPCELKLSLIHIYLCDLFQLKNHSNFPIGNLLSTVIKVSYNIITYYEYDFWFKSRFRETSVIIHKTYYLHIRYFTIRAIISDKVLQKNQ